jgi:hypothetical protein
MIFLPSYSDFFILDEGLWPELFQATFVYNLSVKKLTII